MNKKNRFVKWISGVLTLGCVLSGCAGGQPQTSGDNGLQTPGTYRQISMAEAADLMVTENNYVILDVRRPDEFVSGHIPGAINVPNESIETEEIDQLPDKDQMILVYCRSGNRSKQASEKLVDLGYTNIVEFGGIMDWTGGIEK